MFSTWLKAVTNVLFPLLCLYCGNKIFKGHLCLKCEEKINFLRSPACRCCAEPGALNIAGLCKKCIDKAFSYQQAISVTAYKEPMISLIYLFKYKNCGWLTEFFTSLIIKHLSKIGFNPAEYSVVTAVPMHKYKLKLRGYNQAELLAKSLSNYFKIPFKNDIIRSINAKSSQTKLSQRERRKNVEKTFTVKENLQNKKIILVDDIFTTGATVQACCRELKKCQAGAVTVLTLAKTIHSCSRRRVKSENIKELHS